VTVKSAPIRVQLSRKSGWRMPPNTVKVDRSTRWGNPFDVREYGPALAIHMFEYTARGCWSPANLKAVDEPTASAIHEAHGRWLRRIGGNPVELARGALRGKNLACWCPLPKSGEDDPCHAAILLRIANR
jgi:hypothetical protein